MQMHSVISSHTAYLMLLTTINSVTAVPGTKSPSRRQQPLGHWDNDLELYKHILLIRKS